MPLLPEKSPEETAKSPYLLLESSWISNTVQSFSFLKWSIKVTRFIMTHVYPSKGWILDFFSCQGQNQLWTKLGLRYTLWLQLPETVTWLKILLGLDPRVLTAFPWLHLPNIFPKSAAPKLVLLLHCTQRSFFFRQFVLELNVRCCSIWTHLQIKSQYLMKFWQWSNILLFVLWPQEVLFFTKLSKIMPK